MAQRIDPDLSFIRELQSVGGDSLKKCYQCATCSVMCPISPDSNPFPRKEMIWAQWGMKDQLVNNIDIWLCHNCGACSDMCPRGAKPGDLMSALRNMAYQNINPLPFIGKWMSSAKYLPILAGIPAIIYLLFWIIQAGRLGTAFPVTEDGAVVYGLLFPEIPYIDFIFVPVVLVVAWVFYQGVKNLIASIQPEGVVMALGDEKKGWIGCLIDVIKDEILTHKKFADCGDATETPNRKFGHLTLFYGFICLAVVTTFLAAGYWTGVMAHLAGIEFHNPFHPPMSFANPNKLLAVVGMVLLLTGLVVLTKNRLSVDPKKSTSSYYDWYLLGVIWGVAITGTLSMLLRLSGVAVLAYPMYYLHLICVFMLFAYLPWSKLGHIVYRTAALTYARYIGRKPM